MNCCYFFRFSGSETNSERQLDAGQPSMEGLELSSQRFQLSEPYELGDPESNATYKVGVH